MDWWIDMLVGLEAGMLLQIVQMYRDQQPASDGCVTGWKVVGLLAATVHCRLMCHFRNDDFEFFNQACKKVLDAVM